MLGGQPLKLLDNLLPLSLPVDYIDCLAVLPIPAPLKRTHLTVSHSNLYRLSGANWHNVRLAQKKSAKLDADGSYWIVDFETRLSDFLIWVQIRFCCGNYGVPLGHLTKIVGESLFFFDECTVRCRWTSTY
jgi:hypothetical protein